MIYLKLLGPWAADNLKAISFICVSISFACFTCSCAWHMRSVLLCIFLYVWIAVIVGAAELKHTHTLQHQLSWAHKQVDVSMFAYMNWNQCHPNKKCLIDELFSQSHLRLSCVLVLLHDIIPASWQILENVYALTGLLGPMKSVWIFLQIPFYFFPNSIFLL